MGIYYVIVRSFETIKTPLKFQEITFQISESIFDRKNIIFHIFHFFKNQAQSEYGSKS